jgi:mannitol 2-dehydrogenase
MDGIDGEWRKLAPRRRGANRRAAGTGGGVQLRQQALGNLPDRVAVPRYDRSQLTAGIVHFGVGNFHRAHQAVYLDDLFNLGFDQDWAIVGAGVRPGDAAMREKLATQDYLTTVVEQEATHTSACVTGSMIDFLPVGNTQAIVGRLADPAIRIVSLTVTEGGYYIDPATQTFDVDHADIVADAADIGSARTVFGLILAGLKLRRERGIVPFTVLSCDNIPGNGQVTRNAVVALARRVDGDLADWVETQVAFPNSMVDRIAPVTTEADRSRLRAEFGIEDRWPVFCEEFRQWVVEDHFPAGRPALERVGVQFVEDVTPFELMKIRILNGGHAAIAYAAGLLEIEFVHEAIANPLIRSFLDKVEREEIIPTLAPVPGIDLPEYAQRVVRRFANPRIADAIQRLCQDGSNRQPKFILPTARDRVDQGKSVAGLALVSALWARYCFGEPECGAPIAPNGPNCIRLNSLARAAKDDPSVWLGMGDIYGELAAKPAFASGFVAALGSLWSHGVRATLEAYISDYDGPA